MSEAVDTSPEARAVQIGMFRAMTPEQRFEMAISMSDELMAMSALGRRSEPNRSADDD